MMGVQMGQQKLAMSAGAEVIKLPRNMGKGEALKNRF